MSNHDAVREYLKERGCAASVVEGGLAGLVAQWESLVTTIDEGYALGLDDYLNDLDIRQLLAEATAVAPLHELNTLTERIQRADEQFNGLTEPTTSCLWSDEVAAEENWLARKNPWYYRRPRHGDADLLAEINEAISDE